MNYELIKYLKKECHSDLLNSFSSINSIPGYPQEKKCSAKNWFFKADLDSWDHKDFKYVSFLFLKICLNEYRRSLWMHSWLIGMAAEISEHPNNFLFIN